MLQEEVGKLKAELGETKRQLTEAKKQVTAQQNRARDPLDKGETASAKKEESKSDLMVVVYLRKKL